MKKIYKDILAVSAVAVLLCTLFFGCRKTEEYPVTPVITFKSFTVIGHPNASGVRIDSAMILTISYTDGDGDIGIQDGDTTPPFNAHGPYYYNLVIKYFKKTNGVFNEIPLNPPYSARIPYLTPEGNHKAIKGDITLGMQVIPAVPANTIETDTIRCDVFLYDRALHKSNIITTPALIINLH